MCLAQLHQSPAVRAILLLTPMPASGQDVTEPVLKAAFIYNSASIQAPFRLSTGRMPSLRKAPRLGSDFSWTLWTR
jgi:hypothetical protein